MEAKELRINNYVSNQHGDFGGLIGEPHQFTVADFAWVQLYLPIPLTEEWLVNFGFMPNGAHNYRLNRNTKVWFDSFANQWYFVFAQSRAQHVSIKIDFVHQLQNLYFALTSKELKIK